MISLHDSRKTTKDVLGLPIAIRVEDLGRSMN